MRRFSIADITDFMRNYGRYAMLGLMVLTIAVAGADCDFEGDCEFFC